MISDTAGCQHQGLTCIHASNLLCQGGKHLQRFVLVPRLLHRLIGHHQGLGVDGRQRLGAAAAHGLAHLPHPLRHLQFKAQSSSQKLSLNQELRFCIRNGLQRIQVPGCSRQGAEKQQQYIL
jgi:hypothetical protein